MADIVSLSKARKAKARLGKQAQASENRAKFGRTKAEKALDEAKNILAKKQLDGRQRDE